MPRAPLHVAIGLALAATGCDQHTTLRAPTRAAGTAATTAAEPTEPVIEVTDAARAAFHRIAREAGATGRYWLRVRMVPGGCQGMMSKLDLDIGPLGADDAEVVCGDVSCVYKASQYFLIQGARVDYVTKNAVTGFSVEFPNKTAGNKQKAATWVDEEFQKRLAEQPAASE